MAKNGSFLITKPEIKFWFAILGVIVAGAVAFTTLQMDVKAIDERGIQLRKDHDNTAEFFKEINERTIRMETNQKHIMKALDIEID